jgi:hypothetical protein
VEMTLDKDQRCKPGPPVHPRGACRPQLKSRPTRPGLKMEYVPSVPVSSAEDRCHYDFAAHGWLRLAGSGLGHQFLWRRELSGGPAATQCLN